MFVVLPDKMVQGTSYTSPKVARFGRKIKFGSWLFLASAEAPGAVARPGPPSRTGGPLPTRLEETFITDFPGALQRHGRGEGQGRQGLQGPVSADVSLACSAPRKAPRRGSCFQVPKSGSGAGAEGLLLSDLAPESRRRAST